MGAKAIDQDLDHAPADKILVFGRTLSKQTGVRLPAECVISSHALVRWINERMADTGVRLTMKSN